MTEHDYRSSELRKELARIMEEPALLQALAIIKAGADGVDAGDSEPEIVSVRRLSRRAATESAVASLFRMTTPAPKPPKEQKVDFGTGIDADDFDDLAKPENK
jgi:hypothetical protein